MPSRPTKWVTGTVGFLLAIWAVGSYFDATSNLWVLLGVLSPAGHSHLWTFPAAYPSVGVTLSTLATLGGSLLIAFSILRWATYAYRDQFSVGENSGAGSGSGAGSSPGGAPKKPENPSSETRERSPEPPSAPSGPPSSESGGSPGMPGPRPSPVPTPGDRPIPASPPPSAGGPPASMRMDSPNPG